MEIASDYVNISHGSHSRWITEIISLKTGTFIHFFSRRLIAKTYRKAPKGHPCFTPLETLKGSLKKPFTFTYTMDFYENSHMSISLSTSRNVKHKRFLLMQTYIKKPVSLPVYTISLKVISHLTTTSLFLSIMTHTSLTPFIRILANIL